MLKPFGDVSPRFPLMSFFLWVYDNLRGGGPIPKDWLLKLIGLMLDILWLIGMLMCFVTRLGLRRKFCCSWRNWRIGTRLFLISMIVCLCFISQPRGSRPWDGCLVLGMHKVTVNCDGAWDRSSSLTSCGDLIRNSTSDLLVTWVVFQSLKQKCGPSSMECV